MTISEQLISCLGHWGFFAVVIGLLFGVWFVTAGGLKWCRREWEFLKCAATMPGPKAIPLLGNALYFACTADELLSRLVKYTKTYEFPFRFWMGPKLFVGIKNPRDVEVVLNSPLATRKPYEYRFLASYLGNGIVTDSGSTHRAHRKLIMPMVNGKVLNTFFESFDKHSRRCVECLESKVDTGEFDIMHFMDDCTFDMVLETIMGTPGTAQANGYKGFINYSTRAIDLAHERTRKIWLYPDWIYALTNSGKQYAKAIDVLHEFAETLVAKKKTEYRGYDGTGNDSRTAVLDRLVAWNAMTNRMDDIRLRDEIANIWIPAQDPTALTSSFLFVMLGMHPEIQEKIREEVHAVVGDGNITVEDIPRMKYLEMVFKETVRLFPVGPVILREAQADLEFETCTAPAGCTIAVLVYMLHRDPKYWIEPEKFNPDRFTPENSAGRHPYAFIPFSGGIRGCIGRQYATMVVKTLVARVIQKYRISSTETMDKLRLKIGVSIRSVNGYKVSITKI